MGNAQEWNVRDAKSKFSELIAKAEVEPQTITSRGQKRAVVINIDAYEEMTKDLYELRQMMKRRKIDKLQKKIQAAFEEAGIDEIDFDPTPTRPLPEFD